MKQHQIIFSEERLKSFFKVQRNFNQLRIVPVDRMDFKNIVTISFKNPYQFVDSKTASVFKDSAFEVKPLTECKKGLEDAKTLKWELLNKFYEKGLLDRLPLSNANDLI